MEKIDIKMGLTEEQAAQLRKKGLCNSPKRSNTRSYRHILFNNIFSVFNLINAALAAALIYVGSIKNSLFMLAVISNTLVGIVQEIRSKRTIDKLSILNRSAVTAVRSGERKTLAPEELVLGDIIVLERGCQIPNDCEIVSGRCEVNEALLTGEADALVKKQGDKLLSGSFLVSGSCVCRITAVGSDNYADSLLGKISYIKKTNSEIVRTVNRIISVITVLIVPLGALLFNSQMMQDNATLRESVESTAAVLIGMIPEGLVLLTSTVFALGIVRLSKKNVLSQELYSLESLARTDVICLDKTGTVTTGEMTAEKLVCAAGADEKTLHSALAAFSAFAPDNNATASAISEYRAKNISAEVGKYDKLISKCAFSSERKWSSVTTEQLGTVILGSAELLQKDAFALPSDCEQYRTVAVALSDVPPVDERLPEKLTVIGYVMLRETLREGAAETLAYFAEQGVDVKLISGDSPVTVKRLCADVLGEDVPCADLSGLSEEETARAALGNKIFGRATPAQKMTIISALRKSGHTCAMVGDGVNDVLALKESDCSVALASGSAAARNVSQLVLLDPDFRSLPAIVSEGRRSINNLQSSAALFLTKTVFSMLMAIIFIFIGREYPFEPIQMTLISTMTIGFPSFVLSFIKNDRPISGSLWRNIFRFSVPAAAADIISVLAVVLMSARLGLSDRETATLCTLALAVTGIILIWKIYRPLTPLRAAVMTISAACIALAFILFGSFFGLVSTFGYIDLYMVVIAVSDAVLLLILLSCSSRIAERKS